MNANVQIQQATLADLDELLSFAKSNFILTYAHLNDPQNFQAYLDKAFSRANFQVEMEAPNTQFYLLKKGGELLGYIKLNFNKRVKNLNADESVEMERIYVKPEAKGKGYGKILIETAKKVATEQAKKIIWLGVWENNPKAIGFYRKMGFEQFGEHVFMIGAEVQNDYLMKIELVEQRTL
ncbi:MAG: GNAT family N-acetyltransferase [Bacteroidota bacterium]